MSLSHRPGPASACSGKEAPLFNGFTNNLPSDVRALSLSTTIPLYRARHFMTDWNLGVDGTEADWGKKKTESKVPRSTDPDTGFVVDTIDTGGTGDRKRRRSRRRGRQARYKDKQRAGINSTYLPKF